MFTFIKDLMQHGAAQFIFGVVIVLGAWMAISLSNYDWKNFFKTDAGKGVIKSALLGVGCVVALVLLSLLIGCAPVATQYGSFNNGATTYAGLDYTNKVSPQCESLGPDDHTTSNLGLRWYMWESTDGKFMANLKYTHHSCAFNPDDKFYDAPGIELEYKLW